MNAIPRHSSPGEPSGLIFNIMRYAVDDGPGIRTTVFFKGCPLACWWCHNPEGRNFHADPMYFAERCRHCGECLAHCPEQAIERVDGEMRPTRRCIRCGACVELCSAGARAILGRRAGLAEVLSEIEKDVVFYDGSGGGATLSGGEPLAQPEFAAAILDACRQRGIHTTIETCGFAAPAVLLEVAAKADLVLYDLKLVDSDRHQRSTGVGNRRILENLAALAAIAAPPVVVVRIPVIPGLNDSGNDIADFIRILRPMGVARVDLLPFHRIGTEKYRRLGWPDPMAGVAAGLEADVESFEAALRSAGFDVRREGSR